MAVFEDRAAEIKAAFGEYKHYVAVTVAAKDAEVAEARKKLQDAADSAVSLDAFGAFADELIAEIKGASA